tara:strand:- start:17652 stop:17873 length:222 start_codon:yes stop_codon:yes gene_type:complete
MSALGRKRSFQCFESFNYIKPIGFLSPDAEGAKVWICLGQVKGFMTFAVSVFIAMSNERVWLFGFYSPIHNLV